MIILMREGASESQLERVRERVGKLGFETQVTRADGRVVIHLSPVNGNPDFGAATVCVSVIEGVEKVIPLQNPFKLSGKDALHDRSVIEVGGASIGSEEFVLMAGPCAIESYEQLREAAIAAKGAGCRIIRGGAYKARTSPYSFKGLGAAGLAIMKRVKTELGLSAVIEVLDVRHVGEVASVADIIQIGARNMQNFPLLEEAGKTRKPVLLKRGMMSTIEELLLSAEHIMNTGNHDVILCERGIRTFEKYTRNTVDIGAIPVLKELSRLPVFVDPSHGVGDRRFVGAVSKGAVAAGADGLILEIHPNPGDALSDGRQSLTLEGFRKLADELEKVAVAVGRKFNRAEK